MSFNEFVIDGSHRKWVLLSDYFMNSHVQMVENYPDFLSSHEHLNNEIG